MTWRGFVLGLLAGLALLYAASPWLVEWIVPRLLARYGIALELVVGHPGWHGIDVERASIHAAAFDAVADGVRIEYGASGLARGELAAVTLRHLTVLLGGALTGEAPSRPFELPALWSLIPARHVAIEALDVGTIDPPARAHGSLSFDPALLEVHLDVTSPRLAVPVAVAATLDPDARLTLTVTPTGAASPLLAMHGAPDVSQQQFVVDGNVDLDGDVLALLAAYGGVSDATGAVHARLHGRMPWPLPAGFGWRDFSGDGSLSGHVAGQLQDARRTEVRLDAAVHADAGQISAELAAGSEFVGDLPAVPAVLVAHSPVTVTVRAEAPVAVVYSDAESRLGEGIVLGVDGLVAPLVLKPRGVWRGDGTFELTVTSSEGAPRLLVAGKRVAGADAISAHARLVLAGRLLALLGRALDVSNTGGQGVIDFEGRVPLTADGLAIANALGKGRVEADLSGRSAARAQFEAALSGDYQLANGTVTATLDPGARLEMTAANTAAGATPTTIAASTIAAAPIELTLASGDVALGKTDVKLALPPLKLGKQNLQLSGAWLTLTRATWHGDAIDASALVRARTGRDALPLEIVVQHDLGSGRGRFTVGANWRVTKPLLATQLGLKLPYDLDSGRLSLDLHGVWNLRAKPTSLRGDGRLHVEGDGHDENMRGSGLVAELPLAIDSNGYSIGDGAVRITKVDAGFPVARVALQLAVDDDVAHVSGLRGDVLGGTFTVPAFDYAIEPETASLTVALSGVDLADVLALEGEDVKGSGILDGELPIRIDGDAFSITNGHVKARAPGGVISYKSSAGRAVKQTGLDFVLKALEDFHYDTLESDVALAPDGALGLAVRLHGRNPAVENGRTIQFNLNLTESMPALLESLRAAQGITERIESRLSR